MAITCINMNNNFVNHSAAKVNRVCAASVSAKWRGNLHSSHRIFFSFSRASYVLKNFNF